MHEMNELKEIDNDPGGISTPKGLRSSNLGHKLTETTSISESFVVVSLVRKRFIEKNLTSDSAQSPLSKCHTVLST